MVGAIAGGDKTTVSRGTVLNGYVTIEKNKFVKTNEIIEQHLDDAARFICQVLGYSLSDVHLMNCFQFYRELLEAKSQQESERKNLERWKTK